MLVKVRGGDDGAQVLMLRTIKSLCVISTAVTPEGAAEAGRFCLAAVERESTVKNKGVGESETK